MKAKKVRLANVAKFIHGITFKPNDIVPTNSSDAVVCMRTKNIQLDLDESDLIAIPSTFVKRQEQYLQKGDILVSTANSWNLVGKGCWVNELNYSAAVGGFISILRTICLVIQDSAKRLQKRLLAPVARC